MRFSIRGLGTNRQPEHPNGAAGGARTEHPAAGAGTATQVENAASNRVDSAQAPPGEREDGGPVQVEVIPEGGEVQTSGSPWVLLLRTFAQNKLAIIGVVVV